MHADVRVAAMKGTGESPVAETSSGIKQGSFSPVCLNDAVFFSVVFIYVFASWSHSCRISKQNGDL